MRLLFIVQRYGRDVPGGAETFCREFATRLASRGHEVHVATSCARSYVDWADVYEPGAHEIDGVLVHRFPVLAPRDERIFGPINARTIVTPGTRPLHMQSEWMKAQGPVLPGLVGWLTAEAPGFDVASFFTYLYCSTWQGLDAIAGLVPTILHPTAHDEPYLYMPLFDAMFRKPTAFGFLSLEEAELVHTRFGMRPHSAVTGVGVALDVVGDGDRFRETRSLGDDPYLLFVGRLDPGKGSDALYDSFVTYKRRNPSALKLVVMGEPVKPMPPHEDIIATGFVEEQVKHDALAGALALVQPSYFESFSIVLVEAWVQGTPALVQGRCAVLRGQAVRSKGALPYEGYAEFEAAIDLFLEDPGLARKLGDSGRAYAERMYGWEAVLDRYERFLVEVARAGLGPLALQVAEAAVEAVHPKSADRERKTRAKEST